MNITQEILETLPDGKVLDVRISTHWTAVVVQVSKEVSCGLAATLLATDDHHHEPDVPDAGNLQTYSALELAYKINSNKYPLSSIATATINALLPKTLWKWTEKNAEEVIRSEGAGKNVVIIGRFPFNERLNSYVGKLTILEQDPKGVELPAITAPEILPEADIVAITGMTFINRTLDSLIDLCSKDALVMILGPSTPLSPIFFNYGVNLLSGAVVTDIDNVLRTISQGANFRQVHRAGVSLVTLDHMDFAST